MRRGQVFVVVWRFTRYLYQGKNNVLFDHKIKVKYIPKRYVYPGWIYWILQQM